MLQANTKLLVIVMTPTGLSYKKIRVMADIKEYIIMGSIKKRYPQSIVLA